MFLPGLRGDWVGHGGFYARTIPETAENVRLLIAVDRRV